VSVVNDVIANMFEDPAPGELISANEDAHGQESRLMARKLAALAALLAHRTGEVLETDTDPGYAMLNGFQRTAAEVATAMNLSPRTPGFMVSHAETMATALPEIAALLAEGRTDWRTVELIINRMELVIDSRIVSQLDESLAERIGKWRAHHRTRASDGAAYARGQPSAKFFQSICRSHKLICVGVVHPNW
jgi:hypothetical protein